jgi:hypothetical protein
MSPGHQYPDVMGLARGLERRLEQLVDGLASHLFRGRVHPVELGTRLEREADLAVFDTPSGPGAPNAFLITLGGDEESAEAITEAASELEAVMTQAAAERGWRLEGPVSVTIEFGGGAVSTVTIAASVEPGEAAPWAHLDLATTSIPVRFNRSIIGRSGSSDIHLSSDEVSRHHALLWREAGVIWLADLGSSNGTFVNGQRIDDVIDILDGDLIGCGGTEMVLRVS